MAQFQIPHPWDPGYALPANVRAEPPGRGAIVTAQAPRGTVGGIPRGWTAGYAIPSYITSSEPRAKGGAAITRWAARRTIPTLIPEYLGSLGQATLEVPKPKAPAGDPIKQYGERAAEYLLSTLKAVPSEFRPLALQTLLNQIEPGLFDRVTKRANEYKAKGMSSEKAAVKAALASSMSEGMLKEFIALGKGEKASGLGYCCGGAVGLGFSIGGALEDIGKAVTYPAKKAAEGLAKGAKYAGKGIKEAGKWGKKALDKLGDLACGVVNHPAGQFAAGGAAVVAGAPPQAAQAGTDVARGLCAKGGVPGVPPEMLAAPVTKLPSWVLPAAIGGGGLILVLLLRK